MFLLISGSHIGAPKRYSNKASPYKGAWNVSANNSEAVGHKDLVFYNISFSCLLPLDGFQFIFCCVTVKTISIGFWSKSRGLFASGPVFGCYSWPWVFSFIGVLFFFFFSFNWLGSSQVCFQRFRWVRKCIQLKSLRSAHSRTNVEAVER